MALFCAAIRKNRRFLFNVFSRFSSLFFAISTELFYFQLLSQNYSCSLSSFVVTAVTNQSNKSFISLFNVALVLSYWCIQAIFNAKSIIIIIFAHFRVFHTGISLWFSSGFWEIESLFKSHKVTRTLLSILTDLNNAVVWVVSIHSFPRTNPLVTMLSSLITIGITVTFIFHRFFFSVP